MLQFVEENLFFFPLEFDGQRSIGRLSFWYVDFNTYFMRCFNIFLSVVLYASFPLKMLVMPAQPVIKKKYCALLSCAFT